MQIQEHKSLIERCHLPNLMNMFFLCNNMATPAACVAISDAYKTCPPSKTQRPRALRVSLNKITSQSTLCNSAASSAKRSCECIRAFLEKTLYNKFWEHASVGLLSSKLVGAPRICDCETLCLGRSCPYPDAAAPAALLFPAPFPRLSKNPFALVEDGLEFRTLLQIIPCSPKHHPTGV